MPTATEEPGDSLSRWQRGHGFAMGLCIGCIVPGTPCMTGGVKGTPKHFLSSANNSQENSKPPGECPSCKAGERTTPPSPSEEGPGKGEAQGAQGACSPLPVAAGTQDLLVVLSGSVQGKREGAQPPMLDTRRA